MLKKKLNLILLIIGLGFTVLGQGPPPPPAPPPPAPPPPPPLIYSPPLPFNVKQIKKENLGFQIDFANQPDDQIIESEEEVIHSFTTSLVGSKEIVRVTETKSGKVDRERIIYELKNEYLSNESSRLISEREISLNGQSGKEFIIEEITSFKKIRVFIAGNRIYEVYIDVANWHILNKSKPELAVAFENEAARFFDSFLLIPVTVKGESDRATISGNDRNENKTVRTKDEYSKKTKTFYSAEGGFSIYFPGNPKKDIKNIEEDGQATKTTIYGSMTRSAYYNVVYQDAPTVINEKIEKIAFYEGIKNAIFDPAKGELIEDKEFQEGDVYGREFIYAMPQSTIQMRLYFVKQRLFRVFVVTPGDFRKLKQQVQITFRNLAEKFYDSMRVENVPEPEFAVTRLPDDFQVTISERKFESKFFGFQSELPKGWRFLDAEEVALFENLTRQEYLENTTLNKDMINNSLNKTKTIFIAFIEEELENQGQNLMVAAEQVSFPEFEPETFIKGMIKNLLEKNETVTTATQIRTIDGVKFAWYETFDSEQKTYQRFFVANINKISFQIIFTFLNESDLDDFEKFLKTIRFKKINGKAN